MTRGRDIKARLVTLFLSYRSPSIVESLHAVKAEGFGFNYTRWQQVNDATREQRQQLEAAVAAADAMLTCFFVSPR